MGYFFIRLIEFLVVKNSSRWHLGTYKEKYGPQVEPALMIRTIGFKRTVYKDGKALWDVMVHSIKKVSNRMMNLQMELQLRM